MIAGKIESAEQDRCKKGELDIYEHTPNFVTLRATGHGPYPQG